MNEKVKVFAGMPSHPGAIETEMNGKPVRQIFFGASRYEETFNVVLAALIADYTIPSSGLEKIQAVESIIDKAVTITDIAMEALHDKLKVDAPMVQKGNPSSIIKINP